MFHPKLVEINTFSALLLWIGKNIREVEIQTSVLLTSHASTIPRALRGTGGDQSTEKAHRLHLRLFNVCSSALAVWQKIEHQRASPTYLERVSVTFLVADH